MKEPQSEDWKNVACITLKYRIKLGKIKILIKNKVSMVIKLLRAHGECLGTRS